MNNYKLINQTTHFSSNFFVCFFVCLVTNCTPFLFERERERERGRKEFKNLNVLLFKLSFVVPDSQVLLCNRCLKISDKRQNSFFQSTV